MFTDKYTHQIASMTEISSFIPLLVYMQVYEVAPPISKNSNSNIWDDFYQLDKRSSISLLLYTVTILPAVTHHVATFFKW